MSISFTYNEQKLLDFLVNFMNKYNAPSSFYISGGFIRNRLLKRSHNDIDIVFNKILF